MRLFGKNDKNIVYKLFSRDCVVAGDDFLAGSLARIIEVKPDSFVYRFLDGSTGTQRFDEPLKGNLVKIKEGIIYLDEKDYRLLHR